MGCFALSGRACRFRPYGTQTRVFPRAVPALAKRVGPARPESDQVDPNPGLSQPQAPDRLWSAAWVAISSKPQGAALD